MATINEKMTAIADAIRAKTGGTEPLGLDAMAQAIAGISGEAKVAVGSFTPSGDDIYNGNESITGLGFQPKIVFIVLDAAVTSTNTQHYFVAGYTNHDESTDTYSVAIRDKSTGYASFSRYSKTYSVQFKITPTSNGFLLGLSERNSSYRIFAKKYTYVAIG